MSFRTNLCALVIFLLAVCACGGRVSGGITLELSADCNHLTVGDTVTLYTTVRNSSWRPVNFYLGDSNTGYDLRTGASFEAAIVAGDSHGNFARLRPRWGFCGTGSVPMYAWIRPWGHITEECIATVKTDEQGNFRLEFPHCYVDCGSISPCEIRIRASHAVTEGFHQRYDRITRESARVYRRSIVTHRPRKGTPYWVGDAKSNEVLLFVEEAGG